MTSAAPDPGALFVPLGRPRVMGVVNVTPDSFSDGGRWLEPDAAIGHGRQLLADADDLTLVFQPIVDLAHGRIAGYHALSRFPGTAPPDNYSVIGVADADGRYPPPAQPDSGFFIRPGTGGLY